MRTTEMDRAKRGEITDAIRMVAEDEGIEPEELRARFARGHVVIPKNVNHHFRPRGIGRGLRTKVNANIGTSGHHGSLEEEYRKLDCAVEYGADSVMDLSSGTDLDAIRDKLVARSPVMVGSVPIYQAAADKTFLKMTADDLFEAVGKHAKSGIDYVTVHCGVTRASVKSVEDCDRIEGIVSRGGSITAAWIRAHNQENPLYERFDDLLAICREYEVTLSLGDGLRPGANADATDRGQLHELLVLGELVQRARKAGVQAMVEGPGHVTIDEIPANVLLQKKVCDGAPFYVLGPLVTDVAPGYDHITGAIGGAISSGAGTDFLCYVTPAEHLRLPTVDDVREGVMATRIAAHAGDLVKGIKGAREWDAQMSRYRKALDWEGMYRLSMDPEKARRFRQESEDYDKAVCTMCGELCSINIDNHGEQIKGRFEEKAGHVHTFERRIHETAERTIVS